VATRSGSEGKSGTGSESSGGRAASARTNANGRTTNGSGTTTGRTNGTGAKTTAAGKARRTRASEASATGATARARIASARSKAAGRSKDGRATARRTTQDDIPIVEPTTVPADDSVLAATSAQRAISSDMPRVAWLRTQLMQMEQRQRDRLMKVAQLAVIAIVFITFVLQNATGVNVHFLFFSLTIRLIWVIFGCAVLGGAAGYLIGRPDKTLRALFPPKPPKKRPTTRPMTP
jgi:uncharacterized integral membrane protein